MLPDPADTIVALSSSRAPGGRAIIRLSGPNAWSISVSFFREISRAKPDERLLLSAEIRLPDLASSLPGDLYFWPAPRTYTGQDIVEIHTLSSPPLVELLVSICLNAGARAAQPGEFTMRAFLAGKLDLTQAEAVLGIIEAGDQDELRQALAQLAGGASQPLHKLREDLLNLLADVEAGLDFSEEDIHFVGQRDLLDRLSHALAHVTLVRKQLEQRAVAQRPFRVVLAGKPNAGKSMLFNALLGKAAALVSAEAGTTRDYLEGTLHHGGVTMRLVDTAGMRAAADNIERDAQSLGREQTGSADLVVWCRDAAASLREDEAPPVAADRLLHVATKCDLAAAPTDALPTSAVSGAGLKELKDVLTDRCRKRRQAPLAPSLSRCRHHVDSCLSHLRHAHAVVLHEDPAEVLAVELRGTLDELGAIVGAIYTDDLLDRVFSRFCIGK